MLVSVQWREHNVYKLNIAIIDKVVAGYYMPTAVAIMAFAAFSNINCSFHLKPDLKSCTA